MKIALGVGKRELRTSIKGLCRLEDLGASIKSGEYDREDVPV